eukprot:SAG31_NODE_33790_length_340_cov_0.639004_1_plen_26_part_10
MRAMRCLLMRDARARGAAAAPRIDGT